MCKRQLPNILIMENFNLRKYLAENKLLKEEIDSQEKKKESFFKIAMENEFDGAMDAMDQSPEKYLQDIINYTKKFLNTKDAPLDEFDLSGFFEVEKGVDRYYTKEEAINFMKQWAEDKKSDLAKNKLLKEVNYKNPDTVMENMEDYLEQVYEEGEKDHMDDMMNTFKALSKLASQYMEKM